MLDLLIMLDSKRQALRQRVLDSFSDLEGCFFGLAALIFFAFLPVILNPPATATTAPPEAVVVGALILLGTMLCATIVGAPLGLVFL